MAIDQPASCGEKVMKVFKCILRNCFEKDERINGLNYAPTTVAPQLVSTERLQQETSMPEEEDRQNQNLEEEATSSSFSPFSWFRIRKESHSRFIPLSTLSSDSSVEEGTSSITYSSNNHSNKCSKLTAAQTFEFDVNKEVPTIFNNEFVVPGSDIQQMMAFAMKQNVVDGVDECVICMDEFTPENPRMPTLCGCGSNKTYFHLPCLYQWIEQNKNCPTCRKTLRWEEF